MGLRQLEAELLAETRMVTGKKTLRQRDIVEWSTGNIELRDGERVFYLPTLRAWVAVSESALPKSRKEPTP